VKSGQTYHLKFIVTQSDKIQSLFISFFKLSIVITSNNKLDHILILISNSDVQKCITVMMLHQNFQKGYCKWLYINQL